MPNNQIRCTPQCATSHGTSGAAMAMQLLELCHACLPHWCGCKQVQWMHRGWCPLAGQVHLGPDAWLCINRCPRLQACQGRAAWRALNLRHLIMQNHTGNISGWLVQFTHVQHPCKQVPSHLQLPPTNTRLPPCMLPIWSSDVCQGRLGRYHLAQCMPTAASTNCITIMLSHLSSPGRHR